MACIALKPVVDRLEAELNDHLLVLRVDIQSNDGGNLAERVGFKYTPTFILYDSDGEEIWRSVGRLDPDLVRQFVNP